MLTLYLGAHLKEEVFVFIEDLHRTSKDAKGSIVEVDRFKLRVVTEKVKDILDSYSDMEYNYLNAVGEAEEFEEQADVLKDVVREAKGQLEDYLAEHPDLKEDEILSSLLQTLERVRYLECPSLKDAERTPAAK
jgi:hypothetical protein